MRTHLLLALAAAGAAPSRRRDTADTKPAHSCLGLAGSVTSGTRECPWGRLEAVLTVIPRAARSTRRRTYAGAVRIELCDDRGDAGFSWIVDEPATRTSHALANEGRVWLVDPVRDEHALQRASALGRPAAVVQLLDRHNRDCSAIAAELGIPHFVVPDALPDSPFETIRLTRNRAWHETALWWPATRTLVVAEAIGTNEFFAAGGETVGVHLLLRLTPPRTRSAASSPNMCSSAMAEACTGRPPRPGSGTRSSTPGQACRASSRGCRGSPPTRSAAGASPDRRVSRRARRAAGASTAAGGLRRAPAD